MDSDIAVAFRELREQWRQLSKDDAHLSAAPYDPVTAEAHPGSPHRHGSSHLGRHYVTATVHEAQLLGFSIAADTDGRIRLSVVMIQAIERITALGTSRARSLG